MSRRRRLGGESQYDKEGVREEVEGKVYYLSLLVVSPLVITSSRWFVYPLFRKREYSDGIEETEASSLTSVSLSLARLFFLFLCMGMKEEWWRGGGRDACKTEEEHIAHTHNPYSQSVCLKGESVRRERKLLSTKDKHYDVLCSRRSELFFLFLSILLSSFPLSLSL